jgi:hypothetical protein
MTIAFGAAGGPDGIGEGTIGMEFGFVVGVG